MMRVRRVPVLDQLDRPDERLVLLEDRAVRVVGLGPSLLDLTADWSETGWLTERLAEQFGPPPSSDGDPGAVVVEAVRALAAEGLVEIEGTDRT